MTTPQVQLGDECKDNVTGFKGICIARTEWLNGCWRITLQSKNLNKDGAPQDGVCFDEPQLTVVKRNVVSPGPKDTGGPIPKITRGAMTPRR